MPELNVLVDVLDLPEEVKLFLRSRRSRNLLSYHRNL
jgi:hypothetical protein